MVRRLFDIRSVHTGSFSNAPYSRIQRISPRTEALSHPPHHVGALLHGGATSTSSHGAHSPEPLPSPWSSNSGRHGGAGHESHAFAVYPTLRGPGATDAQKLPTQAIGGPADAAGTLLSTNCGRDTVRGGIGDVEVNTASTAGLRGANGRWFRNIREKTCSESLFEAGPDEK